MAKDYAAISKKIVENIGGVENIASVTHCMTRLRFVVKDEGKINDAAVKATDGVMGVVNQGGQYRSSLATMWKRPTTKCSRWATSARQARWPAARRRSL